MPLPFARPLSSLAAACAPLLAIACLPTAAQEPPPTRQGARVELVGDAIVFSGRIDEASAAAFAELARSGRARRLVISSGGGDVGSGIDMARALFDAGLDVEAPDFCLSSCANYVFPAGRRKRMGRPGAVAWHGNMAHVMHRVREGSGEPSWTPALLELARALAEREKELYALIGVDEFVCWFAKLAPYSAEGFYALSPADMARFGILGVEIDDPRAAPDPETDFPAIDWAGLGALRRGSRPGPEPD